MTTCLLLFLLILRFLLFYLYLPLLRVALLLVEVSRLRRLVAPLGVSFRGFIE